MSLLCIRLSSLEKYLVKAFTHFLIGFFFLDSLEFLIYFGYENPLSYIFLGNIFSHPVGCLFSPLTMTFDAQKFYGEGTGLHASVATSIKWAWPPASLRSAVGTEEEIGASATSLAQEFAVPSGVGIRRSPRSLPPTPQLSTVPGGPSRSTYYRATGVRRRCPLLL